MTRDEREIVDGAVEDLRGLQARAQAKGKMVTSEEFRFAVIRLAAALRGEIRRDERRIAQGQIGLKQAEAKGYRRGLAETRLARLRTRAEDGPSKAERAEGLSEAMAPKRGIPGELE